MANELLLQNKLEALLGSTNVYFQPPESVKMSYPAIVYKLDGIDTVKADNKNYKKNNYYNVTIIHKDPDNDLKDSILDEFDYCKLINTFVSDNLNHYVYRIYY